MHLQSWINCHTHSLCWFICQLIHSCACMNNERTPCVGQHVLHVLLVRLVRLTIEVLRKPRSAGKFAKRFLPNLPNPVHIKKTSIFFYNFRMSLICIKNHVDLSGRYNGVESKPSSKI